MNSSRTKCEIDAATGKPVTRKGGRPVTAIVPVHLYRSTRGYGCNPRIGGALRFDGDRRCLPGAWCGIFLEEGKLLAKGWFYRACGRVQLLSGKESGRMRRSRCGNNQRRRHWPARFVCCAITDSRESITTKSKATTGDWTRFRQESRELNFHTSISGISNAGTGQRFVRQLLADVGERCDRLRRSSLGQVELPLVRSQGSGPRPTHGAARSRRHRHGHPLSRFHFIFSVPTRIWDTKRETSQLRSAGKGNRFVAHASESDSRTAASSGRENSRVPGRAIKPGSVGR